MKKVLMILLATILLLPAFVTSIFADSDVKIELTMDNWDQYFEIIPFSEYHTRVQKDDFGEIITGFCANHSIITLKPEYQEDFKEYDRVFFWVGYEQTLYEVLGCDLNKYELILGKQYDENMMKNTFNFEDGYFDEIDIFKENTLEKIYGSGTYMGWDNGEWFWKKDPTLELNTCIYIMEQSSSGYDILQYLYNWKDGTVNTRPEMLNDNPMFFVQIPYNIVVKDVTGTITFKDNSSTSTGWQYDGYGWWYSYDDGSYPVNAWAYIDNNWYHFDGAGYMQTGWIYDGAWYYLLPNGVMATGWINDGGNWFYLGSSGAMETGWVYDDAWYYMNPSGAMATGWVWDGYGWYHMDGAGVMQTGWIYDGAWYYMTPAGTMATGWVQDSDNWYYMNSYGVMQTGWIWDGAWYYLNEAGIWVG